MQNLVALELMSRVNGSESQQETLGFRILEERFKGPLRRQKRVHMQGGARHAVS